MNIPKHTAAARQRASKQGNSFHAPRPVPCTPAPLGIYPRPTGHAPCGGALAAVRLQMYRKLYWAALGPCPWTQGGGGGWIGWLAQQRAARSSTRAGAARRARCVLLLGDGTAAAAAISTAI